MKRGLIIAACARIAWTLAWADAYERYREEHATGRSWPPGVDLLDYAPPTPPVFLGWARAQIAEVRRANECTLDDLVSRASEADGKEVDPVRFGECIAYMSLGDGVSWFDDHAWFPLTVPHSEAPYAWTEDGITVKVYFYV